MPIQEALSFNDLPALNSSPASVRAAFNNLYGTNPDGICVNSETYFNAVTPAITAQYGHPCYKVLGDISYTEDDSAPPSSAVVGANTAINSGDSPAQISLTVSGAWTEQTGWSSSTSASLGFSEEFSLEGVFKVGTSFSITTTAGKNGSSSTNRTATASVTVTVPPHSKVTVSMVGTLQQMKMNFTAPIQVAGFFGANFPNRVNDHFFWFKDASQVLAQVTGQLSGAIQQTAVFDVQTQIGQATPL
jgi:hypothetical protein